MRYFKCILGILVLLLGSSGLQAQPGQLRFEPFHEELKYGQIVKVRQDSTGYYWMLYDAGVYRWDGAELKAFTAVPGDSTSLPNSDVNCIAIGHAGELWVGGIEGVSVMDPKSEEFRSYLPEVKVKSILPLPDGKTWVGTSKNGLYLLDSAQETVEHFLPDSIDLGSVAGEKVSEIYQAQNGDVWFAISEVGFSILRAGESRFENIIYNPEKPGILPSPEVENVIQSKDGIFWLATSGGGLTEYNPVNGYYKHYLTELNPGSTSATGAYVLMEAEDGEIWAGTWASGLKILNRKTGKIRRFRHQPNDPFSLSDDVVVDLFQDREGIIWVSTYYGSLMQVNPHHDQVVRYTNKPTDPNSISRNNIRGVFEASENELWIGSYGGGISMYHRDEDRFEFHTFDPDDFNTLPNNTSWEIIRTKNGQIWVASTKGICLWRPETRDWKRIPGEDRLDEMFSNCLSMVERQDGKLWMGTWRKGLYAVDVATEEITRFPHGDGKGQLKKCGIKALTEDEDGRLWLGTTEGLYYFHDEDSSFTWVDLGKWGCPSDLQGINDLKFDDQGRLWITMSNGFQWIDPKGEGCKYFGVEEGFLASYGLGIEIATNGDVWVASSDGLYCYQIASDSLIRYTTEDGFITDNYGEWCSTSGESGKLYFGSSKGLVEFFPEEVSTQKGASLTLITGFYLANKPIKVDENGILKSSLASNPVITLDYTDYIFSFSFSAITHIKSDLCEYAYRLKGFKDEWLYTDQLNRRATFTNVPPGSYEFQVKSQNGNGIWDEKWQSISIRITPPWWETWWARMIGIILILGIGYGVYWTRVSTLRRQKRLLEKRVKERTHEVTVQNKLLSAQKTEIEQEKERSENLLLNILPAAVADELKVKQKATPREFPEVSILFSDFVGFTKLSEGLTPKELVAILDTLFGEFDRIVQRHGLEKIKTIGDAYMCTGGLHNEPKGQAVEVVRAGLEMVKALETFNQEQRELGKPEWNMRLGVHTGEVVAGVVGETKFQFDIWGDAVNTASRMESSGEVNRVNVSGATYDRIKNDYACTSRGEIAAKNKGMIEMFLVEN